MSGIFVCNAHVAAYYLYAADHFVSDDRFYDDLLDDGGIVNPNSDFFDPKYIFEFYMRKAESECGFGYARMIFDYNASPF